MCALLIAIQPFGRNGKALTYTHLQCVMTILPTVDNNRYIQFSRKFAICAMKR